MKYDIEQTLLITRDGYMDEAYYSAIERDRKREAMVSALKGLPAVLGNAINVTGHIAVSVYKHIEADARG